jgi:hypothetical protein
VSPEQRELAACNESGHALPGTLTGAHSPRAETLDEDDAQAAAGISRDTAPAAVVPASAR